MISLVLGILNGVLGMAVPSAGAAPPPASAPIDVSGLLDGEISPEERMVSEGLPATPESGSENPQDLLRSGPVLPPARKARSASAKGANSDGMPASLPLVPGSKSPPPPDLSLVPEVSTEIPSALAPVPAPIEESFETVDAPPEPEVPPVEPEVEVVTTAAESSGTSAKKWDRSIPLYDRENPTWAVDLHGSLQALGANVPYNRLDASGNPTGVSAEADVRNFGLGFEYEPKFLQSIGVVSIGPSFNFYILEPQGGLTNNAFSIVSAGLSLKYQLKFMRSQVVVPFVGFEAQAIRYRFERPEFGEGATVASGLTFGALVLLNWMEPSAAHTLWAETGIKRSYLVAEAKRLTSSMSALTTLNYAFYFGLRLEY